MPAERTLIDLSSRISDLEVDIPHVNQITILRYACQKFNGKTRKAASPTANENND